MKVLGILYLNDKTTYVGQKGEKLKKFKSIYNGEELLVKTKRETMHQTYCIVNKNDNTVIEYLDELNINPSLISEKMALLNWTYRHTNIYKNAKNIDSIKEIDLTPDRINILNHNIISVDPDGSQDIDDAISINNTNNQLEIYIHISDPTSYIDTNTDLDNELLIRSSSIYLDKTHHMLPEKLATDIISLKKGILKRAYTFVIKFNTNNLDDISKILKDNKNDINYDFKFIKTNILVTENLTYNEFENIRKIQNNCSYTDNDYYTYIYNLGKIILDGLDIPYLDYDSHKMIEAYMILCNMCASKNCILKRSNKLDVNITNIKNYIQYNQTSAEYTIENNIHEGLNISYTHFTSPIRRYADMIVHRLLYDPNHYDKYENNNNNKLINMIDIINSTSKYYKKVYNMFNLFNLFYQINNIDNTFVEKEGLIVEKEGLIVGIEYNLLKLLIDNKIFLANIVNKKIIDNEIVSIINKENILYINYKNINREYRIGQTINLKIYYLNMNINPFKIIIDNIDNFF